MSPEDFRDLVTRLYLQHGRFLSIQEISGCSGLPEHKLRKAANVNGTGFLPAGVQYTRDIGSQHPAKRYGPTLRHLRDLLLTVTPSGWPTTKGGD